MSATLIEWASYTFNPWWGCARVSRACRHCYADTLARRWGHDDLWRAAGPRRFMSDAYWRSPLAWNRLAAATGRPETVFCSSMADVLEVHPDPDVAAAQEQARQRLYRLIARTPWLTWLLLTKRVDAAVSLLPWTAGTWPRNVWLGVSVESQTYVDARIPTLLQVPAGGRWFISAEPLVGPIDLAVHLNGERRLGWVITGGESGAGALPSHPAWFRSLRDQVIGADVPFFLKQWGVWSPQPAPGWPDDDATRHPDRHRWIDLSGHTTPVVDGDPDAPAPDAVRMHRVDKKVAGRVLDGREYLHTPRWSIPEAA